jgi:hypothetical protein
LAIQEKSIAQESPGDKSQNTGFPFIIAVLTADASLEEQCIQVAIPALRPGFKQR